MTGWTLMDFGEFIHFMPEDEVEAHYPVNCSCCPCADDENEMLIIHNSFDGREAFERGDRKPS